MVYMSSFNKHIRTCSLFWKKLENLMSLPVETLYSEMERTSSAAVFVLTHLNTDIFRHGQAGRIIAHLPAGSLTPPF